MPLAEAWDSRASRWSPAERQAYANDLDAARSLIAVSAKTNRSKLDQDPATWLPPFTGYRCRYIADWIATKIRRQLSIDTTEKNALAEAAAGCANAPVGVTLARQPASHAGRGRACTVAAPPDPSTVTAIPPTTVRGARRVCADAAPALQGQYTGTPA
ncbi:DUF1524 domain-containing protein [Streptomyces sp. NPDC059096]|uniref:GmrSD restriction endonuclease domain-containing protein n=1 Tax=Streptomyces sp. NPDC059096 TaxID=3346727 RepID=UPI0036BCF2CF